MPDAPTPDTSRQRTKDYWIANIRAVIALLTVWALVSFGCGILFADWLNQWRLPGSGFPVGFWFAQQGSIYTFVILIFVYVAIMRRLDRKFGVDEGDASAPAGGADA